MFKKAALFSLVLATPAFAADVNTSGVPVVELVGPYCARFSINGVGFGMAHVDPSTPQKWALIIDRAAMGKPVVVLNNRDNQHCRVNDGVFVLDAIQVTIP
jgi:hypothetical protein